MAQQSRQIGTGADGATSGIKGGPRIDQFLYNLIGACADHIGCQWSVVSGPSIGAARRAALVCTPCAETAVSGLDESALSEEVMRIFRRAGKRESSPYNAKSGGSPSRLESQAFTPVYGCWKNSPRVPKSPRKSHESAHLLGVCRAPDVVWESADRNSKACLQADKDCSWDCRSENRATNLTALFTMRKGRFYDLNSQLSVVSCPSIGAARRAAVVCASCAETAVSGGDRGCLCRAQRSRRTGISAIPSTGPSSPPHERMIWVGGHASSGDHERVSLRRSKRAGRLSRDLVSIKRAVGQRGGTVRTSWTPRKSGYVDQ